MTSSVISGVIPTTDRDAMVTEINSLRRQIAVFQRNWVTATKPISETLILLDQELEAAAKVLGEADEDDFHSRRKMRGDGKAKIQRR